MKNNIIIKIKAWLFPNKCLICGQYLKPTLFICQSCSPLKANVLPFNIEFKRNSKKLEVYTIYMYKDNYARFIKRFKFKGKTSYARKFIGLTLQTLNDFSFEKYDMITYVPMTKDRVKQRGYNQSQLLANALEKQINVPVSNALVKVKSNKIQHFLSPKERKENVKGVYECQADVIGQNIILIDDIITTGATISQCAKILYQNGANIVTGLCIAETPVSTQKEE
ncbi:MAG: hypothetical protein R3Y35_04865 [Clostridia bacterium]